MKCRDAERAMVLSLYGDLDAGRRRSLDLHLGGCPACTRKSADIKGDIEAMIRLQGESPEFDWGKSWIAIQAGLACRARVRRRPIWSGRLVPAAAGVGLVVIGLIVVGQIFEAPPSPTSPVPPGRTMEARLTLDYLESAGLTIREYMNREFAGADPAYLAFEKERARSLLFQNRAWRAFALAAGDPVLIPLLNDLEIILYEASNFEPETPKGLEALRSLIRNKEILFRSGRWGKEKLS